MSKPVRELILESLAPIHENATQVHIQHDKLDELAEQLKDAQVPEWDHDLQFKGTPEETLQYYFFLDSINFCFWQLKGREKWAYKKDGKWIDGYYAYSYAIKKAFENNPKLFDAKYCADMPFSEFLDIFDGKNDLLLLEERFDITKENQRILLEAFEGSALKLLEKADRDVNKLVDLLLEHFPSFRDWVDIKKNKHRAYFLKRAQIFCSDISFALPNLQLVQFKNLDDLTVFADYKILQILEAKGVLRYNLSVTSHLLNERIIESGSSCEMELRAQSIMAIEELAEKIRKKGRQITVNELDWILWVMAKEQPPQKPYHKTITTFY